jgi:hypothetical protein
MTEFALIRTSDNEVISVHFSDPGWVDLPGVGKVSPAVIGWSGNGYAIRAMERFSVPAGKVAVGSPSYSVGVGGIVRETYSVEDAPVERVRVSKPIIIDRLNAAGKLAAARAALDESDI